MGMHPGQDTNPSKAIVDSFSLFFVCERNLLLLFPGDDSLQLLWHLKCNHKWINMSGMMFCPKLYKSANRTLQYKRNETLRSEAISKNPLEWVMVRSYVRMHFQHKLLFISFLLLMLHTKKSKRSLQRLCHLCVSHVYLLHLNFPPF